MLRRLFIKYTVYSLGVAQLNFVVGLTKPKNPIWPWSLLGT